MKIKYSRSTGGTAWSLFLLFIYMGLVGCTARNTDIGNKPVAQVNSAIMNAQEFGRWP